MAEYGLPALSICSAWGAEQPPRGAPWVSGLVGHFVQTWADSECSHTVQFLDGSDLELTLQSLSPVSAWYDPFGVDVPLNFDITPSPSVLHVARCP